MNTPQYPFLSTLSLSVNSPEQLAEFYCQILGKHRIDHDNTISVGYGDEGACLAFRKSTLQRTYQHHAHDRYWKIAITVPDLDCAYRQLAQSDITVSTPHQFRDVGYLCHLTDPEGFVIELLQHRFEDQPRTVQGDPSQALGGAHIGLITLRTDDIDAEFKRCQQQLGMKYLCRQPVTDLGFDLYFFAFTEQNPPSEKMEAIENRPWVYQRTYTVLEFQHVLSEATIGYPSAGETGSADITICNVQNTTIKLS